MSWLQSESHFLWLSFLVLSPMLLLGLFLSGLLHVLVSREAIVRWFRNDNMASVNRSALIGVPIPLCSCSVVPIVAEMRNKGASRSACMSFLITAPETGADSILVTNAFFGWFPAILRPAISYITALTAGMFCILLVQQDTEASAGTVSGAENSTAEPGCCGTPGAASTPSEQPVPSPTDDDCHVSLSDLWRMFVQAAFDLGARLNPARLFSRSAVGDRRPDRQPGHREPSLHQARLADNSSVSTPNLYTVARRVFRYGFIEIADEILFALIVGILLGALIYLAIPPDLMERAHARWISYPVMLLVGVPLYICASASTPIAAALVAKGVSPGAALIFLMTGPATNTSTLSIIVSQFGGRFASVYIGSVVAVTASIGILIDVLLMWTGIEIAVNLHLSDHALIEISQIAAAVLLGILIIWRFRAGALKSGYLDFVENIRPLVAPFIQVWHRVRHPSSLLKRSSAPQDVRSDIAGPVISRL